MTKTFTIQPINLDNYATDARLQEILTIEPVYAKYTGKVIRTAPTVKVNGKKLSLSTKQYTCEYNDENPSTEQTAYRDCGTYTITIVGSGRNFVGETTVSETISDKLITKATITLDSSAYPYNKETGETFPASVTVKDGRETLTEGTHYTVSYKNYDKIGTASVLITGIGDYSGVKTKDYKITGTKLTAGMITQLNKSFVYDGTEHSVVKDTDYTIADGTTTLTEGQDYTVTYTGDRTHAGTFKVTFTGMGSYSGTVTKTFTIRKASAKNFAVTLPNSDTVPYAKGGAKPEPEVRFNGELLTEGTDYTVTYKNNTKTASAEDTKAPYLYITGKGNFADNTKDSPVKFTIVAAPLDAQTIVVDNVPYKNKNSNFVPAVTITDSTTGKKLAKKTDYLGSFTYEIWDTSANAFVPFDDKKVEASEDTIRMRVTISGTGNYTGTARTEYEICPKSITSVRVEKIPNQEYTGQAIMPKLTITDNGKELTEGTDYTLEYSNNTKKGTATVTIRGKGQYGGSKTVKFKITSRIFKWF